MQFYKKFILLQLLIYIISFSAYSENNVAINKTVLDNILLSNSTLKVFKIKNNFLIIGTTISKYDLNSNKSKVSKNGFDCLLINVNSNGDTLWTKRFGFENIQDKFIDAKLTNDNGIMVISSFTNKNNHYETLITKFDTFFNIKWQNVFDVTPYGLEIDNIQNCYILCGKHEINNNNNFIIEILKINNQGNLIFAREYEESMGLVPFYSTILKSDNINNDGFVFYNIKDSLNRICQKFFKIDYHCNVLWEITLNDINYDSLVCNFINYDKNNIYYIKTKMIYHPDSSTNENKHNDRYLKAYHKLYFQKRDINQNIIFNKFIDSIKLSKFYDIIEDKEGNYYVLHQQYTEECRTLYLNKIDKNGNLVWVKKYNNNDYFFKNSNMIINENILTIFLNGYLKKDIYDASSLYMISEKLE